MLLAMCPERGQMLRTVCLSSGGAQCARLLMPLSTEVALARCPLCATLSTCEGTGRSRRRCGHRWGASRNGREEGGQYARTGAAGG